MPVHSSRPNPAAGVYKPSLTQAESNVQLNSNRGCLRSCHVHSACLHGCRSENPLSTAKDSVGYRLSVFLHCLRSLDSRLIYLRNLLLLEVLFVCFPYLVIRQKHIEHKAPTHTHTLVEGMCVFDLFIHGR